MIAVHINLQFGQVLMLKVAQAAFAVGCLRLVRRPRHLQMAAYISSWQADSWL